MRTTFISTASLLGAPRTGIVRMQADMAQLSKEVSTGRMADVGLNLGAETGRAASLHIDTAAISALIDSNGAAVQRVIYTESHDEVANGHARVPEEIWPGNAGSWFSRKRSTLGAALVLSAPGIPMIFQGQEFLEDKYFRDVAPLDWAVSMHGPLDLDGGQSGG